jgi:DNA-binding NarL/FixJ family response regulator
MDSEPERALVVDVAPGDRPVGAVDVALYDLAGLAVEATRGDLERLLGSTSVLGLVRDGRTDLSDAARALGVEEFVPESVTSRDLLEAVERAADHPAGPRRPRGSPRVLSDRERAILTLIAEGRSNQDITGELFLSINTVKTYIRSTYRKIGVHSRSQAVLWAVHHGLVPAAEQATPLRQADACERDALPV